MLIVSLTVVLLPDYCQRLTNSTQVIGCVSKNREWASDIVFTVPPVEGIDCGQHLRVTLLKPALLFFPFFRRHLADCLPDLAPVDLYDFVRAYKIVQHIQVKTYVFNLRCNRRRLG